MKKIKYLILILFSLPFLAFAQEKKLPKTNRVDELVKIDTTYAMLNNYLICNNYIEKENTTIYLFNLLSWNEFDLTDSCGIYVFGINFSDPTYFLFFANKDKTYSIIKDNALDSILAQTLLFFKKNSISDKRQQLIYSYGLIKYFNSKNEYLIDDKILPHEWTKL